MSKQRTKRVIGNWKMRPAGRQPGIAERSGAGRGAVAAETSVGVCVPFPYLAQVQAQLDGGRVAWGAQDVSAHEQGAFTGEVAAAMVAEFGARYAIVGHSGARVSRRTNETVAAKQRALAARLTPVVCVGETLDERESGATEQVVGAQLDAVLAVLTADEAARIVVASRSGRSARQERDVGAGAGRARSCVRVSRQRVRRTCPCCTAAA